MWYKTNSRQWNMRNDLNCFQTKTLKVDLPSPLSLPLYLDGEIDGPTTWQEPVSLKHHTEDSHYQKGAPALDS